MLRIMTIFFNWDIASAFSTTKKFYFLISLTAVSKFDFFSHFWAKNSKIGFFLSDCWCNLKKAVFFKNRTQISFLCKTFLGEGLEKFFTSFGRQDSSQNYLRLLNFEKTRNFESGECYMISHGKRGQKQRFSPKIDTKYRF